MTNSASPLQTLMLRKIEASPQQRISFAEFMDSALHHPQYGYYATRSINLGAEGDFFTSPHLGSDLGELLAEQLVEMWQILEQPVPFTLLEMGAGQGILAADILQYLQRTYPDCFEALDYCIVERSAALIAEQKVKLRALSQQVNQSLPVRWQAFTDLPAQSVTGCYFSNELVDAFPVHRIVLHQGQLQEVYVTTEDGQTFVEAYGEPSTPALAQYFQLVDIELQSGRYPEGYCSEVNLAALEWIEQVAKQLRQGYLLTIDYGYPAQRYYSPARSQGTLLCYYQHQFHDNPYQSIGEQDITAHVDFTALERAGQRCGLDKVGFTQQGLFLMALGLGNRLAALSEEGPEPLDMAGIQQRLRRRAALQSLIDPTGLGNFGVLIQSKGLTGNMTHQPLRCLQQPSAIF